MCSRNLLRGGHPVLMACVLSVVLSGVLFPRPLSAQTPRDSLKQSVAMELERLLLVRKRLGERWREAEESRKARERAENQLPMDTFQVGPFRLVAVPGQRGMAQELFAELWEDVGTILEGSEALIEPWTFVVRRSWGREELYLEGDSLALVGSRREHPMSMFRETARNKVGIVLRPWVPEEIMEWTGHAPFFLSDSDLHWVAWELATTPSVAVRRCYQGELDWCRRALGLAEEEGGWAVWYTPPERRLLVSSWSRPTTDPRRAALWDGCAEFQELRACDLFLADLEPRSPLTDVARESLFAFSLRMGGTGSFERLRLAPPGPLEEQLARVAGVSPDSLLASWRREALQAQPSAWAGLARTPVAALFWFLFFGILAARSTRWRLG